MARSLKVKLNGFQGMSATDPLASRAKFARFIGVDLGGGKGKKTALACLRRTEAGVVVESLAPRAGERPLYDPALIERIRASGPDTLLCIDAPLRLPACLRCAVAVCPGQEACTDPAVVAMGELGSDTSAVSAALVGLVTLRDRRRGKPVVTPYTQRATEVWMHRRLGILPRETLGQGMGPLAARATHLLRALAGDYTLNRNVLEVYPKATLSLLGFTAQVRRYKKHLLERQTRGEILEELAPELSFAPGVWREECVQSDHTFDAVLCAYTGYLWARDGWQVPAELAHLVDSDGWIWVPPAPERAAEQPLSPAEAEARARALVIGAAE